MFDTFVAFLDEHEKRTIGKVQLIQKSSKIIFLDIFVSFNRAQRALQEYAF